MISDWSPAVDENADWILSSMGINLPLGKEVIVFLEMLNFLIAIYREFSCGGRSLSAIKISVD